MLRRGACLRGGWGAEGLGQMRERGAGRRAACRRRSAGAGAPQPRRRTGAGGRCGDIGPGRLVGPGRWPLRACGSRNRAYPTQPPQGAAPEPFGVPRGLARDSGPVSESKGRRALELEPDGDPEAARRLPVGCHGGTQRGADGPR